jgi:hypothetical protein
MVGEQSLRRVVDAALLLCFLAGAARAIAQEREEADRSRPVSVLGPRDPRLIRAVTLAVRDASDRLESAECRLVFSDFTDAVGATLAANLTALDHTGQSYLRWLIFHNGSREAYCDRGNVALAADPGSRFVAVCGVRFVELQRQEPGYAAALVIHEQLHVLGLRENPPSSVEITRRVIERCGR